MNMNKHTKAASEVFITKQMTANEAKTVLETRLPRSDSYRSRRVIAGLGFPIHKRIKHIAQHKIIEHNSTSYDSCVRCAHNFSFNLSFALKLFT